MTNIDTITLTASGTATFAGRWNAVVVTNDTAALLYVTTNNVTPNSGSPVDGQVVIPIGGSMVLTNELPEWRQTQSVIKNGTNNYQGTSLAGGAVNPGTIVQVVGTFSSNSCTIQGCG